MGFSRQDILDQLDHHARDFTFPMLDNGYMFLVDTRLTAWRDETRWALAIEIVGYNPRAGQLDLLVHRYGNCLDGPTGTRDEDFLCPVTSEIEDSENSEHTIPGLSRICLRDHEVPLIAHADPWRLEGLYRSLVPTHRDLLFANDAEMKARFPVDLALVLRLEEWHHPNLVNDQLPSGNETFVMIADVLRTGDLSRYAPTKVPNTHWSHWPDGGSL